MPASNSKSPLERFLGLFTQVRAGEGVTASLLFLNLLLVLTSYYIAKVVREPLILTGGGAELKSYLSAGQLVLILGGVRLYAWLAGQYSRRKLINTVNIFFSACMVLFYILAKLQMPALGVIFFLWVGMFNVMVVAQCWSFANDLYTPENGKRLFAIIAFGATLGGIFGAFLPAMLISVIGLYEMLILASGVLLTSLLITNYVDLRERKGDNLEKIETSEREPVGKEGAFALVFRNQYLLLIAFLIMTLNWVNTNGEYMLGNIVADKAESLSTVISDQEVFIATFYAQFFFAVNVAAALIQLFLVSRIIKYIGIRFAIMILPVIAFGGYFILAFFPILSIVRWAKIGENSTDYSLNNTVRHALFLPTSREDKYKAKQAIDSFFHRSGDVLSALVVAFGTWMAFQTTHFAFFNLALILVWLVIAVRVGHLNKKMEA